MKMTITQLNHLKQNHEPIAMVTCYDASFARLCSETGMDILLVGDSLGNVIQGRDTTIPVSMDDMVYHTRCVARGNQGSFLISDMPFMAYAHLHSALENAARLMQAGAMMLKLEGGQWLAPIIKDLVMRGIPVCAHLGLTPQSVHKLGGFKMQARQPHEAQQLIEDAQLLEQAGAQLLVLECIPPELAAEVSHMLAIPVIGIGAGNQTDGQVLVLHDLLGLNPPIPKFAHDFLAESGSLKTAIQNYIAAVKNRQFPA